MSQNSPVETVIAIPPIPFRSGRPDLKAQARNLEFLVQKNFLQGGGKRAVGIAGTSLVHHLDPEELLRVFEAAGQVLADEAVLIAGVVPTPFSQARDLIRRSMALGRPPDYFLLMPVPGVCNPQGIAAELERLIEDGAAAGARFLLYMRSSSLIQAYAQTIRDHQSVVGIKVGTKEADVKTLIGLVGGAGKVLWGVGDRATAAARFGSRGHTSGITLICPRACDEIHNAYCRGDFEAAEAIEADIQELEDVRFMEERAYNYSAVVAAARLAGFTDVDVGEGGPFNAEPPPEIMARLRASLDRLRPYHQ